MTNGGSGLLLVLGLLAGACAPAVPTAGATGDGARAFRMRSRTAGAEYEEPPTALPDLDGDLLEARTLSGEMLVHMIDVGQGAATLVEFPCGAVLIDTGGEQDAEFASTQALTAYLDAFFVERPDLNRTLAALYITHPHIDHTRGVPALLDLVESGDLTIEHVVTNGAPINRGGNHHSGGRQQERLETWARGRGILTVADADTIAAGAPLTDANVDPVACSGTDPTLGIFWGSLDSAPAGWNSHASTTANNESLVIRIDYGEASMVISGDLEAEAIGAVLARHGASVFDVDIVQVGHHGSANATTADWVAATSPAVVLIAMGDPLREFSMTAWDHGHPRRGVVETWVAAATELRIGPVQVLVADAQESFSWLAMTTAVYGTGWDGSTVVRATSAGTIADVATER
jgi:competence protein ComEC